MRRMLVGVVLASCLLAGCPRGSERRAPGHRHLQPPERSDEPRWIQVRVWGEMNAENGEWGEGTDSAADGAQAHPDPPTSGSSGRSAKGRPSALDNPPRQYSVTSSTLDFCRVLDCVILDQP